MLKRKLLSGVVFLITVVPGPFNHATLLAAPITVSKVQDLNFGKVTGVTGTVTIDPAGARSFSGGVQIFNTPFSPAQFTIQGTAGKTYVLTLPSTFTISSGTSVMTVSAVTSSIPTSGVVPTGGVLSFKVGGTLSVSNGQRSSSYSGTFDVTVR